MNKLNLSFIMSSFGDELRCKDLHATGVVEAQALKVKQGGNFAAGGAYRATRPVDGSSGTGFTPGAVGDIVFTDSSTGTDKGVWLCTTAGGAAVAWTQIAKM